MPTDPLQMRAAVVGYIEEVHQSYLAQADTFAPAVRGRMPLLAGGQLTVAAVGARNLHILATREGLGPVREPEVEVAGELPGLNWTVRFYDPIVIPALGLVDESQAPAFAEIRACLGIGTVVYHLVAEPGSGLNAHNATHVGTGLANGHTAAARDFEAVRHRLPGREALLDELVGASVAGLGRAQALLAAAIAPRDPTLEGYAELARRGGPVDPEAIRRTLLASVGGRKQWTPQSGPYAHNVPETGPVAGPYAHNVPETGADA